MLAGSATEYVEGLRWRWQTVAIQ